MNARPARLRLLGSLALLLTSGLLFAQEIPIRTWEVPFGEFAKLGGSLIDAPAPFSAITPPCRLYDSRVTSGGPGPIPGSSTRAFDFIPGGSAACGVLPSNVRALSLYLTLVNPLGPGFIYAFPTGSVPATPTSIINYNGTPGELRNNAAILAVNTGTGGFTIGTGGAGTDIIIDINGIFYTSLEANDLFFIGGNRAGAVIYGFNGGSAANTNGLQGTITSLAGSGSSGVYGTANVGGSNTSVVYGGEFVTNSETTGSAGVLANSDASSGEVYGLLADNDSSTNGAAGVWGRIGSNTSPVNNGTVGVLGTSIDSGNSYSIGVYGFARSNAMLQIPYGVYGVRLTTAGGYGSGGVLGANGTSGVHSFEDITANGTKSFVEPHPTDPDLEIAFVSLEGPEVGTYFRGRGRVQNGLARIAVPESFRLVSEQEGLSIQAMPIGEMATFAVARIDLNEIVVKASRNVEFFYTVNGIRKGRAGFQAIRKNDFFRPAAPTDEMLQWPPATRAKLVANGILTQAGSPNLETAERLGWKAAWEKDAADAKARREQDAAKGEDLW